MEINRILNMLLGFYPRSFQKEFSEEINADLADLFAEVDEAGRYVLFRVAVREVKGILIEAARQNIDEFLSQLRNLLRVFGLWLSKSSEGAMAENEKAVWERCDQKMGILASLPPLVFGAGISLTWLVIGARWYEASELQLRAGLAAGLLCAGLIAAIGIYALIKRFPTWGFAWIGADIVGFLLLAQGIAEEREFLISREGDLILIGLIMLFSAVVFLAAVLRSWQAAGLVSIGMATTLALSNVHLMAIPPYHRTDLAVLGLGFGLLFSLLTFAYLKTAKAAQILMLLFIGLFSLGIIWLANFVWLSNKAGWNGGTPFIPMAGILLLMLLAGPIAGLFQKPIKLIFERLTQK